MSMTVPWVEASPATGRLAGGLYASAVALALTAVIAAGAAPEPPPSPSARVRQILGARTAAVLRQAARVETFRLGPVGSAERREKLLSGYRILHQGADQGQAFARRLAGALFDEKTYGGYVTGCGFSPEIGYRVWSGKECVEVALSFRCDQLMLKTLDARGEVVHTAFGAFGTRPLFLALSKGAFPKDPFVRRLPARRPAAGELQPLP